jgi:hypothetical protein
MGVNLYSGARPVYDLIPEIIIIVMSIGPGEKPFEPTAELHTVHVPVDVFAHKETLYAPPPRSNSTFFSPLLLELIHSGNPRLIEFPPFPCQSTHPLPFRRHPFPAPARHSCRNLFPRRPLLVCLNGNTKSEQPTSPRLPTRHAQRSPRPTAVPEIDHNTCRPGQERGCKARNKRKRYVEGDRGPPLVAAMTS